MDVTDCLFAYLKQSIIESKTGIVKNNVHPIDQPREPSAKKPQIK